MDTEDSVYIHNLVVLLMNPQIYCVHAYAGAQGHFLGHTPINRLSMKEKPLAHLSADIVADLGLGGNVDDHTFAECKLFGSCSYRYMYTQRKL